MWHLVRKGLLQVASVQHWLDQQMFCVDISAMILQAVPSAWNHAEGSELYQLPHFNTERIKQLKMKKRALKSVHNLMEIPLQERTELLSSINMTDKEINEAFKVARVIPKVTIENAAFEVKGEDRITPESLVTFVLKLKAFDYSDEGQSYGDTKNKAELQNGDYEEDDDEEDDDEGNEKSDAPKKRSQKLTKLLSGTYWKNPNIPVHCPYYPQFEPEEDNLVRPCYYVWLCNTRNKRSIGPPMVINKLVPTSLDGKRSGTRTAKLQFQAPPQTGTYTFDVIVKCDAYVGVETRQEVKLKVVDVDKAEEARRLKEQQTVWEDYEEEERIGREIQIATNMPVMGGAGRPPPEQEEWSTSESEDDEE